MVVNSGTLARIPVATFTTYQRPQHPLLTSEVPNAIAMAQIERYLDEQLRLMSISVGQIYLLCMRAKHDFEQLHSPSSSNLHAHPLSSGVADQLPSSPISS